MRKSKRGKNKRIVRGQMTLARFWRLIENAKTESRGDSVHQGELLTKKLARLSIEEITAFDDILEDLMDQLETQDVIDVYTATHEGWGLDDFEGFQGWIIAQGEIMFKRAVDEPRSLIGFVEPMAWCEGIVYAATLALELKTGIPLEVALTSRLPA